MNHAKIGGYWSSNGNMPNKVIQAGCKCIVNGKDFQVTWHSYGIPLL